MSGDWNVGALVYTQSQWDSLTADRDRLSALLRKIEPALDETIAWISTDQIGCVEVEARAEQVLRDVRNELGKL